MHPHVSAEFTGQSARVLHQLEADTGKVFFFEGSEGLPLDHFEVIAEGAADEIAERAVPFSAGDEVLVHVVEPHMYNVDDAVAKIDGYIISVTGGGKLVGSKVLVRVDEAGRTSARATVIGDPIVPEAANGATPEDDGDATPKPRRRGRRGGRRRSPATKAAAPE
jgi:ribonuclease G